MLLNNTVVQYERYRRLLKQRRLLFTSEITGGDNTVKYCLNILYTYRKYMVWTIYLGSPETELYNVNSYCNF